MKEVLKVDFYKQLEDEILMMPTEQKVEILKKMGLQISEQAIANSKIKQEKYIKKN